MRTKEVIKHPIRRRVREVRFTNRNRAENGAWQLKVLD